MFLGSYSCVTSTVNENGQHVKDKNSSSDIEWTQTCSDFVRDVETISGLDCPTSLTWVVPGNARRNTATISYPLALLSLLTKVV